MDSLGCSNDGELFGLRIEATDHSPTLDRRGLVTMLAQLRPHDLVSPGEDTLHVAEYCDFGAGKHVATQVAKDWGIGWIESGGMGHNRRKLFIVDSHHFSGVFSQIAAIGHYQNDRVAYKANLIGCESRID